MAAPVGVAVVGGRPAVGWVAGHDRLGAGGADGGAPGLRGIATVADDAADPAERGDGLQQRRSDAEFGRRAGDQREGERPAVAVAGGAGFRAPAAARAAEGVRRRPPFAPAAF